MSDFIRLLPDSVANQIAAGEVIQRPASVIKELVENAVDAGATDIRIFVRDAGRTLIQVVDNGKGMSVTDARMAFERHATSKIRMASDLFSLHTMGFRGEALPSICAISHVEMKTRMEGDTMGTSISISGSKVESQEPCVCEKGTNIMVKDLFYNVPARRKFLKSDNVELSNIMREFERLALVNNTIRMNIDTGSRGLDLRAGTFKQRIADIWKNNLNMQLLPVDVDTSLVKIHGFVSRPEFARRRNPLQYLIVNGRNMRHPYFHKAIAGCYDHLIASDTQPCYFLKFEVDPASIDVNIHPTKHEIKFEYEQEIWPILQASVKAALGRFSAVPSIDFTHDVVPVTPIVPGSVPEAPTLDIPPEYNPFEVGDPLNMGHLAGYGDDDKAAAVTPNDKSYGYTSHGGGPADWRSRRPASNWDSLYSDFMRRHEEIDAKLGGEVRKQEELPGLEPDEPQTPKCMQLGAKFIVTTSPDGLLIIDQHRAHVKILFEQYMARSVSGLAVSQSVMFPEVITLDPEHRSALEAVLPELERLGYVLEYEEGDNWRIIGVPAVMRSVDARDVVLKILDSVCSDSVNYGDNEAGGAADAMLRRVALLMARSAAIRKGRVLSVAEMENMVKELFSLPDPALTPNGNHIFCLLDESRLDALFR